MNTSSPQTTTPPVKEALKVCLTDGAGGATLGLRDTRIGYDSTPCTFLVQAHQIGAIVPDASPAVRGASVRGRVSSVPLKKANWLADRLHSIGRFEGRRQSIPGKWTRWGLSEGQEGEPIRTEAMGGPAGPSNHEGVPKALIRRVLTEEMETA